MARTQVDPRPAADASGADAADDAADRLSRRIYARRRRGRRRSPHWRPDIASSRSARPRLRPSGRARLLLMAHPLAQPAEALVDLDHWVRDGGRVLLLADPMLEWPSKRPLGDKLRPPPSFADTGLLAHWGLDARMRRTKRDRRQSLLAGFDDSRRPRPGRSQVACEVRDRGFVARCSWAAARRPSSPTPTSSISKNWTGPTDDNLDALARRTCATGTLICQWLSG